MDSKGPGKVNILIVKLSAIGDVVHTLPALAALRELYPEADITWVVEESSSDIIKNHPYLNRVIISRRKQWVADLKQLHNAGKTIAEIRSFIAAIREIKYDLVIDFHGLFKSSIVVLLSGGKRKLGYDSMQELSGLFLSEKIFEDMDKHAVDRYLDFIRYLGADIDDFVKNHKLANLSFPRKRESSNYKQLWIPDQVGNDKTTEIRTFYETINTDNPEFYIPIEEENRTRVKALLKANGIDINESFVAINPVAFWDTKLWEDDKFARLCDRITEELEYKVVFTGSKGHGSIERIRSMMTVPSINLEGQTTLRDLAYLYSLSGLLITTDSGPMHIAAAMNTPTVALFGPTDPSRTGPYGKGHIVVRKEMPCSPCFLKKCDTKRCMKEIGVDEVFEAVRESISRVS